MARIIPRFTVRLPLPDAELFVNAGRIVNGEATIADVGWELFHLMLSVASGKKTWAEHWKLHNALTLFNPAPVT